MLSAFHQMLTDFQKAFGSIYCMKFGIKSSCMILLYLKHIVTIDKTGQLFF